MGSNRQKNSFEMLDSLHTLRLYSAADSTGLRSRIRAASPVPEPMLYCNVSMPQEPDCAGVQFVWLAAQIVCLWKAKTREQDGQKL